MEIKQATFVCSSAKIEQCPTAPTVEYAFIGRSNVGKSSLINMLANNKKLAKTSGRPGKTQLINHFLINETWHLVDLPGYGYAKVSKSAKRTFQKLIEDYILERQQLSNLFVLLDSRHPPQKIDLEFMQWLGECQVPFSMVFTKTDKLKDNQLNKNLKAYSKKMLETWSAMPTMFATSAETSAGKAELLNYIGTINTNLKVG